MLKRVLMTQRPNAYAWIRDAVATDHSIQGFPRRAGVWLTLAIAMVIGANSSAAAPTADVLIRGGEIVDGTGHKPYVGDVAIVGERIKAVGELDEWEAERVIDASGLYVTPGFIDVHSHADRGLDDEDQSYARPQLAQGVTTVVINPDGGGAWDMVSQRESIEAVGAGVNVAQMVGHNRVRREAMGGSHDRAPSSDEMEQMRQMVRDAMEAGAFGMSTGLFYVPGAYAETEEVIELAEIVAEYDGVHSSHIRDESDYDIGVVASVDEIIEISRESGVVGVVSHIKTLGPNVWGESQTITRNLAEARADGVEVWADQYPYSASSTSLGAAIVPAWAREGGRSEFRERLEDPETFERIREEMIENIARRGGPERIQFRDTGRYLDEVAETGPEQSDESDMEPVDAALEILKRSWPSIISHNMHEDDIHHFMRQHFMMTSTDGELPSFGSGSTHPRTYGAFARKLRKYVREEGVVDLPHAIRSMSGLSAEVFRLEERGAIRPGMKADVLVFDLERVDDPATYLEPHAYSEGMSYVLVNGELAIEEEEFAEVKAGRVLRHQP